MAETIDYEARALAAEEKLASLMARVQRLELGAAAGGRGLLTAPWCLPHAAAAQPTACLPRSGTLSRKRSSKR